MNIFSSMAGSIGTVIMAQGATPDTPGDWLWTFGIAGPAFFVAYYLLRRSDKIHDELTSDHEIERKELIQTVQNLIAENATLRAEVESLKRQLLQHEKHHIE